MSVFAFVQGLVLHSALNLGAKLLSIPFLCTEAEGRRLLEKEIPLKSCCSSSHMCWSSSWNLGVSKPHVSKGGCARWSDRVPKARSPLCGSYRPILGVVHGCGVILRLWPPQAPLRVVPLHLHWAPLGLRKDENERGFLPYLWKLERNCPQSGSDDPCLSAKHTQRSEICTLIRNSFWKFGFNPMSQMITTNGDQGKPKSTANFNLANA